MGERGIVALTITECREFWHLYHVFGWAVKCLIASMPNCGTGRGKELLGTVQSATLRVERGYVCVKMSGQSVHLLGIESRVSFHEGDGGFHVLAFGIGSGFGNRIGIDNQRAFLALAYLPAQFSGLLIGHPQGAI